MSRYYITISATYETEIENLERDRQRITEEYENPVLPDFLEEIDYIGGEITYERITD